MVMGLGRFGGGIAVARWLIEQGAQVVVTDRATGEDLASSVAQLADLPISYRLGGHDAADLDGIDLLVVSPAVPKDRSAFVQAAIERDIPISSEMNLFLERCPVSSVVGVTGSAGKSTTTAMLQSILAAAQSSHHSFNRAWVGGNIGRSLLCDLNAMEPEDVVVLELSSFQLDDVAALRWSPRLAVITNLEPNHLDRHGSLEAYADAKMNIVRYQESDDKIFLHRDDDDLAARVTAAGAGSRIVTYRFDPGVKASLRVPGTHNRDNAAAAIAVARELGVRDDALTQGLSKFTGLPHRLEFVGDHAGVRYFNDSKSTTPVSTRTALDAFDEPVVLMVGGGDKGFSFDALGAYLAASAKAVVCYGETGTALHDAIRRHIDDTSAKGTVESADSFADALDRAKARASRGDVVVLSPGCTSYDMFTNYEQRGDAFRQLVSALGG